MNYEYSACSARPRLLILLTDELEESVKVVNSIIERIIGANYDGAYPKSRFYIIVIGYNSLPQLLISGNLKKLDENYNRFETKKENISDGAGGTIEIDRKYPVWVESMYNYPQMDNYPKAIQLAIEEVKKWGSCHKNLVPAPIVIDISYEQNVDQGLEEIECLKSISTKDGSTLFFGCYSDANYKNNSFFNKIPEAWKYRFVNQNIEENEYIDGLFNRDKIIGIIDAITYVGNVSFFEYNDSQ